MDIDAEAHLLYRVANAPVLNYPFPHFYVESVFPDEYYRDLLEALPPLESYIPLSESGTVTPGAYPQRFCLDILKLDEVKLPPPQVRFWREMAQWMGSSNLTKILLDKFRSATNDRFTAGTQFKLLLDMRLFRDVTQYAIGPHTDTPSKLMSLLFYLPRDDSMRDFGTSIFEPLEPGFTCDGSTHHEFEDFRKVYTAPFRPNSLFGFFKNAQAFHGVERIESPNIVRDTLQYNLYMSNLTPAVPPR